MQNPDLLTNTKRVSVIFVYAEFNGLNNFEIPINCYYVTLLLPKEILLYMNKYKLN